LLIAAAPESSVSLSCLSVVREAMPRRTGLLTLSCGPDGTLTLR
jgi:hypothetical protein